MQKLSVRADECLYIGNGGSHELEAASALGMTALQAVWYLQEGTRSPMSRKPGFHQLEQPLAVLSYL